MDTDDEYPATTNMADDEDALPEEVEEVLPVEPCGVCGRKFNLSSLPKHERICERTAAKKRKPFDSAKQRIQGTELAEFLPKLRAQGSSSLAHDSTSTQQQQHHHHHHQHHQQQHSLGRRSSSTGGASVARGSYEHQQRSSGAWKQTHDEFLRAIRAARGDSSTVQHQPTSHHQNGASSTPSNGHHHQPQSSHNAQTQRPTTLSLQIQTQGAPTRPNEKGQCPTCHRLFGVKSYERHVAFCKERSTRVPASPLLGNNLVAKERLEARMKYRAPALKNRRPTNKEKYSPSSNKLSRSPAKEPINPGTMSAPASTTRLDGSPKLPVLKRPLHSSKESLVGSTASSNGPLKSRPMDRSNRQSESHESLNPPALRQLFASRRLFLISDVLPSKIIKSPKNVSPISKSPMKSSAKILTQYVRKGSSDFNVKMKSKKKTKIRDVENHEDEEEEEEGSVDIAWKRTVKEEMMDSIDKEVEPVLSQVTIPGDNPVDDCSDKTVIEGHESDNDTIKYDSDADDHAMISDRSSMDRTYILEDEVNELNNNVLCPENVVYENIRVCTHISEEDEPDKSSDSGTVKSQEQLLRSVPEEPYDKPAESTVLAREKTLLRPRKCQSLPNVDGIIVGTPRPCEVETVVVDKIPDTKEKRCATYVKEEYLNQPPAGEPPEEKSQKSSRKPNSRGRDEQEKWHLHRCNPINPEPSKRDLEVYDYYRNEAAIDYSDVGSVGTIDPPSIEYDSDYIFETESNASDLIKEIDSSNFGGGASFGTFATRSFSSESQVDLCVYGMNRLGIEPTRGSKLIARIPESSKSHDRSQDCFLEETSSSTIEARTPRRKDQHFEKEIYTITRLDSLGREKEVEEFLPSIGWSSRRTEFHREKLVKIRPQEYREREHSPPLRRAHKHDKRSLLRRSFERLPRCDWHSYIRRHPDFSMILRNRIGLGQEYDPFLLAEQQLNDLFSDTSDQSSNDGSSTCPPSSQKAQNSPTLPSSPTSAFAKYPATSSPSSIASSQPTTQRASVIAPPMGFDDLTSSDLSSECNSISREVTPPERHILGRRMIIDQSQALGGLGEFAPVVSRSNSVRTAPKPPERKTPFTLHTNNNNNNKFSSTNNNNYKNNLNGSLSSLSSDAATEAMMKRSNSLFDELLSSFEEDCTSSTLPSLMSLMRNDPSVSLLSSSQNGTNGHQTIGRAKNNPGNGSRVQCSDDDADLSSPESLKGKECVQKLSADSAYSSLNRKYSAHGRSSNDVSKASQVKLSRFCHNCGFKYPDSAKFCCVCGFKRLTI